MDIPYAIPTAFDFGPGALGPPPGAMALPPPGFPQPQAAPPPHAHFAHPHAFPPLHPATVVAAMGLPGPGAPGGPVGPVVPTPHPRAGGTVGAGVRGPAECSSASHERTASRNTAKNERPTRQALGGEGGEASSCTPGERRGGGRPGGGERDRGGADRERPAGGDRARNLYIHNVPKEATEEDVRQYFSQCGEVENVSLRVNQKVGPHAVYAFVLYRHPEDARKCFETLNGSTLRKFRVGMKENKPT